MSGTVKLVLSDYVWASKKWSLYRGGLSIVMEILLLGHDQVVFKDRWSLNIGGFKDKFHCNMSKFKILLVQAKPGVATLR